MIWLNAKAGDNILYISFSLFSHESPRAHWLRRACKLGSPLLAAETASIKNLL